MYFSVSEAGQQVSLQSSALPQLPRLPSGPSGSGGTVTGCPITHDDGRQSVHCEMKFTDHGVKVEAYAFITAPRPHPLRPDKCRAWRTAILRPGRPRKPIRSAFERGEWRDQRYQHKAAGHV